jgi:hypothetical protein
MLAFLMSAEEAEADPYILELRYSFCLVCVCDDAASLGSVAMGGLEPGEWSSEIDSHVVKLAIDEELHVVADILRVANLLVGAGLAL